MKPRTYSFFLSFSLIFLTAISLLAISFDSAHALTQRVIQVTASQFQFDPGRVIVNQGDTITFKVKSADVTHGFYIDGYGVDREVNPGDEVTITIVADKPGKFKIRCSSTCGPLHPFMVGELVVEQWGFNYAFLSSASAIFLVGAMAMLLAWRRD